MNVKAEETTVQDDVRAAMAGLGEEDKGGSPATEEGGEPSSDRDEMGRFKPRSDATKKEPETTDKEDASKIIDKAPTGSWQQDKPPQSWTPAAREKWASIPEDLRREIIRREEAAVMGVRRLQEQYQPIEGFYKNLEPYVQEARQFGVAPEQYIANVMHTERVLRTADLPSKFNALMGIADQYGIPLREIINQSVGEEVLKSPRQQQATLPPEFRQEIEELRSWRQSMEMDRAVSTVNSFSNGKEFFEDVRGIMADLVERGICDSLEDAYDRAVWMNPDTRKVMLDRQQRPAQDTVADRQLAAKGVVKPKGTVKVQVEDDGEDDLQATIRKAMKKGTGRV